MSTTIDQKVVQMQFDNTQFERNVSTTMSTLDKLKNSLNFTNASKGLENINAAAKSCDMSSLGSAVETVGLKFNALYSVADQALRNITNSAMAAGKKIASALTIDPMKTGFQEYETQINAVQTILANTSSKGTTLDDVNTALDTLNTYADKTIYNFTEMTRNIGTFTAAGTDLQTSVDAIQGIANLAAVSGSTSQQASTAMYQLSQAMASGTVKLMDWNSVVNAGMGGQLFQDALKETSELLGTGAEAAIKAEGSFRESLTTGWLTSEVLTETLKKFTTTGANERVAEYTGLSKEAVEAALEEAEALYGEADAIKYASEALAEKSGKNAEEIATTLQFAKTAEDAATKVKTFTQLIDTLKESVQSGWTQTWEIVMGDFEEAKALFTEVSDTLGALIGASADARNAMLQGWKDLGGRTALIESIRNAFNGVMSVIKPIKEAFREIFPPTTSEQLFNMTKALQAFTEKLTLSDTASANLKRTFKGLFAILDIVKQMFSAMFTAVGSLVGMFDGLGGGILSVTASWGDWVVNLSNSIRETQIFNKIFNNTAEVIGWVITVFKNLVNTIKEKLVFPGFEAFHAFLESAHKRMTGVGEAAAGMKKDVVDSVNDMGKSLVENKFIQALKALLDGIKTIGKGIVDACSALVKGIGDMFSSSAFDGAMDLANTGIFATLAVGITKFLKGVSSPFEEFGGILEGVTGILDGVKGCFEAWQTSLKADALLKIAGAIAILAASILVIATIDSEKLGTSLGAISLMFVELLASMTAFNKISGSTKGTTKAVTAMIGISTAVLILASALKKVADLSLTELTVGLGGVLGLTAIVVGAAKLLGSGGSTVVKGAGQMVLMAAAIKVLASACKDLSELSWEELGKGLSGVGVLMLEVAAFTKLAGSAKHILSTGVALVAIGAGMKILASAVKDMAAMSWEELGRGLTALAGSLTAIVVAVNLMPKNMISIGTGLLAVSASILVISQALGSMGGLSWDEIGKGLVAMAGSMTILAVGLNVMNGTLAGSAALLVAAAALAVLTPVLSVLGAMSWESIGKGLVAIAGAFTVLGVAGLLLGPLTPVILGLSAALALLGVGVAAIGGGILALSAGFTALAAAGTAGATAVVAALTIIITGVINLIPAVLVAVGEGIISLANVIAEGAPAIGKAVKAIILALIDVIVTCVPKIVDAILLILTTTLETIAEYTPRIVNAVADIIVAVIEGLAERLPDIVEACKKLLIAAIECIAGFWSDFLQVAKDLIGKLIDGFLSLMSKVGETASSIISNAKNAISSWCGKFKDAAVELINKLIDGFKGMLGSVKDTASNIISGAIDAIKSWFTKFKDVGGNLISGMIEGVKSKAMSMVTTVVNAVKDALNKAKEALGINSPSKEFFAIGQYVDEGFIEGVKKFAGKVQSATEDMCESAINGASIITSRIADAINNNIDAQPTIRPVLDLSNVESGAGRLNALFSRTQAMSISAGMNGSAYGELQNGEVSSASGNVFSFTQNNYSPKALSRVEIYRQTKNQFSAMERMVST